MAGRAARPAVTLMELILVLAIVIVLAGLAFPSLKGLYLDEGLTQAGDQVRGAIASARSHAINDGIPYKYMHAPGTGHWRIAPDLDDTADMTNPNTGTDYFTQEGHFPLDIKLGPEGSASDDRPDPESVDPSSYTRLITFYPTGEMQCYKFDGTVIQDYYQISMSKGAGRKILLVIRPLTGSITTHWEYPDGTIR